MIIKERGSQFEQKVTFDMAKKTVTYHVPAHGEISESDVLLDFNSNITVTRLPKQGVCHVRPRSADEPSMDLLRDSMNKVSSGRYKLKHGTRVLSNELTPTRLADRSKLSKNVIEFCRGVPIYEMKKVEQDGITVRQGAIRSKRAVSALPFCKNFLDYDLRACAGQHQNYVTRCKFNQQSCVYWVTCPGGLPGMAQRSGYCTSNHIHNNALCCDLSCP